MISMSLFLGNCHDFSDYLILFLAEWPDKVCYAWLLLVDDANASPGTQEASLPAKHINGMLPTEPKHPISLFEEQLT